MNDRHEAALRVMCTLLACAPDDKEDLVPPSMKDVSRDELKFEAWPKHYADVAVRYADALAERLAQ